MSDEVKREELKEAPGQGKGIAPLKVDPDLDFVKALTRWGGGDLNTCFQCATCSVVCPLAPEENPFPRKEMIWAQWGLKDRLACDPDLWLCHRCGDCSENCPRGAKTGDVMAALRSAAYQHNAWPGFLGRWINMPSMLPVVFAIPVLVILAVIYLGGNLAAPGGVNSELHSMYWGNMLEPWPWLDLCFIFIALFAVLSFGISIKKLWGGFNHSGVQQDLTPKMSIKDAIIAAVMDILFHRKFDDCGAARPRRYAHMLILFGFAGLFATTGFVFVGMYLFGLKTPLPLGHWIKLLGNISAITITVGLIWAIVRRTNADLQEANGRNSYQDVLFLGVLTLVVISGILSEVFRLSTANTAAATAYFVHLVCIFFLLFYAPFSKFAHVVYHATTLTWAHYVGRKLKSS